MYAQPLIAGWTGDDWVNSAGRGDRMAIDNVSSTSDTYCTGFAHHTVPLIAGLCQKYRGRSLRRGDGTYSPRLPKQSITKISPPPGSGPHCDPPSLQHMFSRFCLTIASCLPPDRAGSEYSPLFDHSFAIMTIPPHGKGIMRPGPFMISPW